MGLLESNVSFVARPSMPGKETPPNIMRKIVWLNDTVFPGSPYFEIVWFVDKREPNPPAHTHDFDEIVGFIGSDPDDPANLNGTVEFLLDGETIKLTRSTVIYIPAGMEHCPFSITEIKKPIIHFSGGPGQRY